MSWKWPYVSVSRSKSLHDKKIVPDNVVLVFPARCGQNFAREGKIAAIFKNYSKMANYLAGSESKNVHLPGTVYDNMNVELTRQNSLLHGVFRLPMNISQLNSLKKTNKKGENNVNNFVPAVKKLQKNIGLIKNVKDFKLHQVLSIISRQTPPGQLSIVFAPLCRGHHSAAIHVTNHPGINIKVKNNNGKVIRVIPKAFAKTVINRMSTLRRKSHRAQNVFKNHRAMIEQSEVGSLSLPYAQGPIKKPTYTNYMRYYLRRYAGI